ncbi:MAG: UDP-glucose 4-epimerase GalE [Rhodobacteraceae bacterium]|nr:UDP-glucose 4-epimerase GalE [Paracoccaceae bacterium]
MAAILVSGGAGFIGAHVCKMLAEAGHVPVAFDNLSRGREAAVKWGPLVKGDIAVPGAIEAAIASHRAEAVIHLAGLAYVQESVADPLAYYLTNAVGSANVLAAMKAAGVRDIVLSGSCSVYADSATGAPLSESSPLGPVSPYARSKVMMEKLAEDTAAAHGLRWVSLRYFNAAGADPEGAASERDPGHSRAIPNVLRVAAGALAAYGINGTDYPTNDGTCVRDYIHVCDLAAAHVAALDYLHRGGGETRLNLGTGQGHSVKVLVDTARRITGKAIPTNDQPRRAGDAAVRVADASLARKELGWSPRWTKLDDMIAHAWASRDWAAD